MRWTIEVPSIPLLDKCLHGMRRRIVDLLDEKPTDMQVVDFAHARPPM